MIIFKSDLGTVEQGFFTGIRFIISTGHLVKPTPWMKHRMGQLSSALKARGVSPLEEGPVKSAFWEYFLDLAHAPANGLQHRVEAETPIDEVADEMAQTRRRAR